MSFKEGLELQDGKEIVEGIGWFAGAANRCNEERLQRTA